jgi:hypothetical protein
VEGKETESSFPSLGGREENLARPLTAEEARHLVRHTGQSLLDQEKEAQ